MKQVKVETAHRTELEWAEVCSGRKFQRREVVLVLGFFCMEGRGKGYARRDYFSAECRVTGRAKDMQSGRAEWKVLH